MKYFFPFFVIIFLIIQRPSVCTAQEKVDIVYLKNGNIIKGTILEINVGENIKIKTREGNLFVFKIDEIKKIEKDRVENNRLFQLNKLKVQLDDYNSRQTRDLILVLTFYGLTIAGDAAIQGDIFTGSFIPVVGPFLTLNEFGNYPNADTHKLLMILSGTVQTIFFIDYIYAKIRASNIRSKINLVYVPYNKTMVASLAINF